MVAIYQQLPKIVLMLTSALIAYQAALLTWSLYPKEESAYTWTPPKKSASKGAATLNTKQLQQQHLFGESSGGDAVEVKEEDAPKTRLKLTLVGIVAASDPKFSSVIIEYKGEQDSYFIDSEITGTKAKVTEIYSDRIIITVRGQKQTLILDGLEQDNKRMASIEDGQKKKSKANKSKRTKKKGKSKEIALDREALLSNPGKLMDYIRISPVRQGNAIKGYRVNPGKDPSIFQGSGLKAGDLAIELNGIDLTDMSQAMGLMKEFPTMTDISLTVDRDGELNELFFSIP